MTQCNTATHRNNYYGLTQQMGDEDTMQQHSSSFAKYEICNGRTMRQQQSHAAIQRKVSLFGAVWFGAAWFGAAWFGAAYFGGANCLACFSFRALRCRVLPCKALLCWALLCWALRCLALRFWAYRCWMLPCYALPGFAQRYEINKIKTIFTFLLVQLH